MSQMPLKHRFDWMFSAIEYAGLVLVLLATIVAAAQEVGGMLRAAHVDAGDILLLFIYLEIVTMSGVYWRTGRLPVRMPCMSRWWRSRVT